MPLSHEEWVRWRSCESKVRYSTRSYADSVAKRTPKKARRRAKAYFCNFCKGYHVGHDMSGRAKSSSRMVQMRRRATESR